MTNILVIDDDETLLTIVEATLTNAGYEVTTANSGEEGLESVNASKPKAILLDKKMPGIDGDEVLKRLKANNDSDVASIPVIMLTGKNEINEVANCFDLGAADYIVKPFDEDNLILRLRKVLST